eukprot:m.99137 g.99137  ORF g.99137 m.99137 type:complete len:151 (-) comp14027_c0_seq3:23-475(-)
MGDLRFDAHIFAAFECVRGTEPGRKCVRGDIFTQLLTRLTETHPPHVADYLLQLYGCDPSAVVRWATFHTAVSGCVLYSHFLTAAETLFASLSTSGPVSRTTCDEVLLSILPPSAATPIAWPAGSPDTITLPLFLRTASTCFLRVLAAPP